MTRTSLAMLLAFVTAGIAAYVFSLTSVPEFLAGELTIALTVIVFFAVLNSHPSR